MREVKDIFDLLASTSSTLKKKQILADNINNENLRRTLNLLLNPFVITGISKKKIAKAVDKAPTSKFESFFDLMDYLIESKTGSDEVITNLQDFLSAQEPWLAEFYSSIITKTARIGCDVKTINKVFGDNFIPQWEIQQSYSLQNVKLKPEEWFSLSQKLNGVRGTVFDGKIMSRQGKEFQGLEHILRDLSRLPFDIESTVFDGELVRNNYDNVSDNENFRIGTGLLSQDDADKSCIRFVIFDVISKREFMDGESDLTYKDRYEQLREIRDFAKENSLTVIDVVEMYYVGHDQSMIDIFLDKMTAEDKEGLMLNRDSKYQCKRHNGILKIKRFYTVDLEIVDMEEGTGRLSGKLGAFVVMYKENRLNVGSGMTDEQRDEFWSRRDELIGRVIEVKYKEESYDKKSGLKSLQFPIFVALRELGKEISYS